MAKKKKTKKKPAATKRYPSVAVGNLVTVIEAASKKVRRRYSDGTIKTCRKCSKKIYLTGNLVGNNFEVYACPLCAPYYTAGADKHGG